MTSTLKDRLETGANFVPPCGDYAELLDLAVSLLHVTKEKARRAYGNYSYLQWRDVLSKRLDKNI